MSVAVIPFARLMNRPVARALPNLMARRQVERWHAERPFTACFVHMAIPWALRLGPWLRRRRIPLLVWYAHGAVSPELLAVEKFADRLLTSTPEGCRLDSAKVRVIGQGVDVDTFAPPTLAPERRDLLVVARLSPRKRIELLLEAMAELERRKAGFRLRIIGAPVGRADRAYQARLREKTTRLGLDRCVEFLGHRRQAEIPAHYASAFLHLNVSLTGSLDKDLLEALACGCPVLTTNEAARELLRDWPESRGDEATPTALADRIEAWHARRDAVDRARLRSLVVGRHDEAHYVAAVMENLRELAARDA